MRDPSPFVPLLLVMLLLGLGCEGNFDCSAVAVCLTTENTVDCFGQLGRDDCLAREHTFDITVNSRHLVRQIRQGTGVGHIRISAF